MNNFELDKIEQILEDKVINNIHWYQIKFVNNKYYYTKWVRELELENWKYWINNYNKLKFTQNIIDTSFQYILTNNKLKDKKYIEKVRKIQTEIKVYGNYSHGDTIKKILLANNISKNIILLISWNIRNNGLYPLNSILYNYEIYDKSPNKLIDFYESKIFILSRKIQ